MFAYVKYIEDGCKEIVPISDIKDFDSDLTKTYWVRWQDKYFKGQILFIKESREEIEEQLRNGKRVRVRLLKDSTPPRSRSEKEEAKTINTNQKKAAEEAKRNNLLALLKERKMKRKQSPLCPTPSKTMRAQTLSDSLSEEDDDDTGVVPEKLLKEARQKQLLYQKKINNITLQLQETKNKLEEEEKIRTEVEAENKELRSLNMQLQQQLLKTLKSSSAAKCSDPGPPNPKDTLQTPGLPKPKETLQTPGLPKPKETLQNLELTNLKETLKIAESGCLDEEKPSASSTGDEIHLGENVRVRSEAWSRIQNSQRDSLFVKELAVAIWGTKTLGERSLTGKECPTTKTTKQPLTPQKFQTLKVCFKEWLAKKNVDDAEMQARLVKAGRFITEKIMDINRPKNLKKTLNI
ncbi:uncharacterized protein [Misgurnus anguillicaudatus]|uniref:uncharacterized protein n=1 Tax=Misgurnus anguillicaudatus TaxID=75329 RepID=UPI003CCF108B